MSHPSILELSTYADDALPEEAAKQIDAHIAHCGVCRASIDGLRAERAALKTVFAADDEPHDVVIPQFSRPAGLREFAMVNIATGLVIWLAQFLWKTIFGELAMNALDWAVEVYMPDLYSVASSTFLYLLNEGTAMFDAYFEFILFVLLTLVVGTIVLFFRNSRSAVSSCIVGFVCVAMLAPTPASALEVRRDESTVTIAAGETIDDTLVIAAQDVEIHGTVTGDVIAAGQRIEVTGSISGNLMTFAESVEVTGSVGGYLLGASSSFELDGATVEGDLWAAMNNLSVDENTRIGRNATAAGQSVTVEGTVNKDLYTFAESLKVVGNINEDVEAFANRIRLVGNAKIGGDLRLRTNEELFEIADSVEVKGETEFLAVPEEFVQRNRYATFEFYFWQLARLISAFLVGLALFWLIPRLRNVTVNGGIEGLKTVGIGFVTMVSVPIMAGLVAITLVGIPFSVIAIAFWLLLLYLAKIVVGGYIGRAVIGDEANWVLSLLAGIAIVIVTINIPYIGGIISFLFTLIGLGLLVQFVFESFTHRPTEA